MMSQICPEVIIRRRRPMIPFTPALPHSVIPWIHISVFSTKLLSPFPSLFKPHKKKKQLNNREIRGNFPQISPNFLYTTGKSPLPPRQRRVIYLILSPYTNSTKSLTGLIASLIFSFLPIGTTSWSILPIHSSYCFFLSCS